MINYTIIIPHKNSQTTLAYVLSTIPLRDDVQVIVVDDNSDPREVDFEHFPQWDGEHYEYYLTKEGKGAGYARNVGLEHAKGKWVLFVDADDFLLPTIGEIMDREVNTEADIIYFRPKAVKLSDRKTEDPRADRYNALIDDYFRTGEELGMRIGFPTPWTKLIKRSLIESIDARFEEIRYSNDVHFSNLVGCAAKTICVRNESYYVVTRQEVSLTCGKGEGEAIIRADALMRACRMIRSYGCEVDFVAISNQVTPFLFSDKNRYRAYFKQVMELGYSKEEITRKIFTSANWKATIKRKIYSYIVTFGL